MKLINLLNERKNPELNPKINRTVDVAKYANIKNAFVHFSNIPKIGIHPQTFFTNNPLGIWAYPIGYYLETRNDPYMFAHNRRYMYVFQQTGNILTLSNNSQILDFWNKAEQYANESNDENLKQNITKYIRRGSQNPIRFWNSLKNLFDNKFSINSNKLFRKLGYDGVLDDGNFAITSDIESQSIHFNIKTIKMIDSYFNPPKSKKYRRG